MARKKATVDTEKITITTNVRVVKFLERLIETGLFGNTKAEVTEHLIRRSMEDFLMTDKIDKLNKEL